MSDRINDAKAIATDVFGEDDVIRRVDAVEALAEWGISPLVLMPVPPARQWIPCSEQLPEDGEDVLVTRHFLSDEQLKKNAITESFYVEVASHMDDEWTSYSDEYKIKRHLHKVIAWMPLPEPFREDGGTDEHRH